MGKDDCRLVGDGNCPVNKNACATIVWEDGASLVGEVAAMFIKDKVVTLAGDGLAVSVKENVTISVGENLLVWVWESVITVTVDFDIGL